MGKCVLMSSACPGSVRYWAAAVATGRVLIDADECRLPLRHSHHRQTIVGPNGPQSLTVPLVGESHTMDTPLRAVRISEHGNWRHLHWGALYSAYGRTPYFEHVAPELEPIIKGNQTLLLDYNLQLQRLVVDFMALPVTIEVLSPDNRAAATADLRGRVDMKKPDTLPIADIAYHQIWADRQGFVSGLSILDLLMHQGPTAIITLRQMAQTT